MMKIGSSKMIGSITTLGYIVMVILNYWPWGGWRSQRRAGRINMKRSLMKSGVIQCLLSLEVDNSSP